MTRLFLLRPGAIGDALVTFPIIRALRRHTSASYATFVSNSAVLQLAQDMGLAEEVSSYDSLQWSELFLPTGIRSTYLHALLQESDRTICWLRDPDGIVARNLQAAGARRITIAPGRPESTEQIHIVTYLARTAGIQLPSHQEPFSLSGRAEMHQNPPFALHPGSGGRQKCWPPSFFAVIITALWQRKVPVLLLAGPADTALLIEPRKHLPASTPELTVLHNAPLLTVARQLSLCRGYLGNDSGITHLAALLGLPTLALFGPSDPAIWRPYGSHVNVLHEPVLANLSPERVLHTLVAQIL